MRFSWRFVVWYQSIFINISQGHFTSMGNLKRHPVEINRPCRMGDQSYRWKTGCYHMIEYCMHISLYISCRSQERLYLVSHRSGQQALNGLHRKMHISGKHVSVSLKSNIMNCELVYRRITHCRIPDYMLKGKRKWDNKHMQYCKAVYIVVPAGAPGVAPGSAVVSAPIKSCIKVHILNHTHYNIHINSATYRIRSLHNSIAPG